jgi:hypothetical protein
MCDVGSKDLWVSWSLNMLSGESSFIFRKIGEPRGMRLSEFVYFFDGQYRNYLFQVRAAFDIQQGTNSC